MKKYLDKARKKPEHTRKRISKILAIIMTFFIFIVWFIVKTTITNNSNDKKPNTINILKNDFIQVIKSENNLNIKNN